MREYKVITAHTYIDGRTDKTLEEKLQYAAKEGFFLTHITSQGRESVHRGLGERYAATHKYIEYTAVMLRYV